MIRRGFSEHIKTLEQDVTAMGLLVVKAIEGSIEALKRQDLAQAQRIVEGDEQINRKRWEIEELLRMLKQEYTLVIVTHNMQQAARASDYTGFMYLGRLVEFGQTAQIFTNPKDKLTENYISGQFG